MKLNHLHIAVPDVEDARYFYERYFDFSFVFQHGKGIFLRDAANFYCWSPGPFKLEVSWNTDE